MTDLIIILILSIALLIVILIYMIINGLKALKRTREIAQAKKCPYKIEGGNTMPKNHVTIAISIPVELNKIIDSLVEESKKTTQPLNKSQFITTMCHTYLLEEMRILDSQKKPEKEEK